MVELKEVIDQERMVGSIIKGENAVVVRIEPGHFHVEPDQPELIERRGGHAFGHVGRRGGQGSDRGDDQAGGRIARGTARRNRVRY